MLSSTSANNVVEVALQLGGRLSTLTYKRPKSCRLESILGRRVQVEVGKRKVSGVITREGDVEIPKGVTLKEVQFVTDDAPILTQGQLDLAHFVSDYYEAPFYDCVKLCLPKRHGAIEAKIFYLEEGFRSHLKAQFGFRSKSTQIRRKKLTDLGFSASQVNDLIREGKLSLFKKEADLSQRPIVEHLHSHVLNDEQQDAIKKILGSTQGAFLLDGVTGSGKTEVYLAVAKHVLSQGRSALFIVPEIGLTPQLLARVQAALEAKCVVVHSNVTAIERDIAFEQIRTGEARVVIGARSALFCPAQNLGLIVVDEEHDSGFKQEESPRYHARDVALWRANHEKALIVLGSATPSLESILNVERGRLTKIELTKRVGPGEMPLVEIIDLRERRIHEISRLKDRPASHGSATCILSAPLRDAIEQTLADKQQAILFLNRRGWASYMICEDCGNIAKCPDCSISLTYHKKANLLRCHQCSFTQVFSTKCPACPDGVFKALGLGTERVEKELQLSFPGAVVARFDRESVRHPKELKKTLERLHSGEIQILIGTQMIAKGHDFPNVTLVGVVLADNGLSAPDFRASERAFQLITQVAGRAGRRETRGRVIIQTYNPEHPSVCFAKTHDVKGFSLTELESRRLFSYPPFTRAALLRIEATSEPEVESLSVLVRQKLDHFVNKLALSKDISILGPAPCANLKLRKFYRWQIFLKSKTVNARKQVLHALREDHNLMRRFSKKSRIVIDVDPVQML